MNLPKNKTWNIFNDKNLFFIINFIFS